jgi:hypothetical protein
MPPAASSARLLLGTLEATGYPNRLSVMYALLETGQFGGNLIRCRPEDANVVHSRFIGDLRQHDISADILRWIDTRAIQALGIFNDSA